MIEKKLSRKEIELAARQTPWGSIYVVTFLLGLLGVQMSIYFTSTWQYLSESDDTATVDFFGAVIAISALACAFANPLFGWWSQATSSTKSPIMCAFSLGALGNLIYAFAYLFPPNVKWFILLGRFFTGFSPGCLGTLRSFVGTASTKEDRVRAVSISNAGFTAGFFMGPTIQICFIPIGKVGFFVGPLQFNMYTICALFMFLISAVSVLVTKVFLKEDYVGIISDDEKEEDPFFVLPKFDRLPVAFLFYSWWLMCGIVCVESLSAPVTIAMFNWEPEDAVLYNGIIQTVSCVCTTFINVIIASTRLRHIDNRKLMLFGLSCFASFCILHLPLPFYPGPLDRPTNGTNGGCTFDWCDRTPRVPIYLYCFISSVLLGFAFPFVSATGSALLSQVVGPRRQGLVQGLFAFTGSFSQFVVSLFSTRLFEHSGYVWIITYHLTIILIAIFSLLLLWKRMIPLQLLPKHGKATKYKRGIFYRM